jgi:hypothetical protein
MYLDDILKKLKLKTKAFYLSSAANKLKIAADPEVNCMFSPATSILKPKNIFNSNETNNNNTNHTYQY